MVSLLIPLVAAAIIAILALLLWRVRGLRVSRGTIISAVAALVIFQILFFLQGTLGMPGVDAPLAQRVLLALAIVLTLNAGVELAKWALLEFALRPKHLRIPLFLVDDKHAFTTVLTTDPSILEALLDALDKRRTVVESRLAEENAKAGQSQAQTRETLLRRIGGFLGIALAPA